MFLCILFQGWPLILNPVRHGDACPFLLGVFLVPLPLSVGAALVWEILGEPGQAVTGLHRAGSLVFCQPPEAE